MSSAMGTIFVLAIAPSTAVESIDSATYRMLVMTPPPATLPK